LARHRRQPARARRHQAGGEQAFAEERPDLQPLPQVTYRTVLKLERRVSHEGMSSVGGNRYSVPDATRRRVLEVHCLADDIRIFEGEMLIANLAPLECRDWKRLNPAHCRLAGDSSRGGRHSRCRRSGRPAAADVPRRRRSATGRPGRCAMTTRLAIAPSVVDRIKRTLVGLRMPLRENCRAKTALMMARLATIKTLAGFDFSFQPSPDRNRILALAELKFIDRWEIVRLLGPPDPAS